MKKLFLLSLPFICLSCFFNYGACEYKRWDYSVYPFQVDLYTEECRTESAENCDKGMLNTCQINPHHCTIIESTYTGGICL